jgi:hypothetical protein
MRKKITIISNIVLSLLIISSSFFLPINFAIGQITGGGTGSGGITGGGTGSGGLTGVGSGSQPANNDALNSLFNKLADNIINPALLLLFAITVIYFLFGVVMYIAHLDDEKARESGAHHMLWGIIGIAIMVSVYAIINIIQTTINGWSS